MKRIDTATRAPDLFGAGKDGFRPSNPGIGQLATKFDSLWANSVQEELISPIEFAGMTPDNSSKQQLLNALLQIFGGGRSALTHADDGTTFDSSDAGQITVDASAGDIALTMPFGNLPATFQFVRIDTTNAHVVSISRQGGNFIDGGTVITLGVGQSVQLVSVAGGWRSTARSTLGKGVAQIHRAAAATLIGTTSTTYVSAGASLVVNKKLPSNIVIWHSFLDISNDDSSSPAGALGKGRMTVDQGAGFAILGIEKVGGVHITSGSPPTIRAKVPIILSPQDDGTLPASYTIRNEVAAADSGVLTNLISTGFIGIEYWNP